MLTISPTFPRTATCLSEIDIPNEGATVQPVYIKTLFVS
jgi:hypothetical protein